MTHIKSVYISISNVLIGGNFCFKYRISSKLALFKILTYHTKVAFELYLSAWSKIGCTRSTFFSTELKYMYLYACYRNTTSVQNFKVEPFQPWTNFKVDQKANSQQNSTLHIHILSKCVIRVTKKIFRLNTKKNIATNIRFIHFGNTYLNNVVNWNENKQIFC